MLYGVGFALRATELFGEEFVGGNGVISLRIREKSALGLEDGRTRQMEGGLCLCAGKVRLR